MRQRPQFGRLLTPSDNQVVGGHPVAVISHAYWRRQLGGAQDAVGRAITINGTAFTIVGITMPEFFGTTVSIRTADAWVPLMMQSAVRYSTSASSHGSADLRKPWPPQADVYWLNVFVRLPRGAEPETIAAAMTARRQADTQSRRVDDADYAQRLRAERVSLVPAGRGLSPLRDASSRTLYVLLGMMAVLLIIASGNVAGLLVARASSRERELAVRLSLGAGRARLVRQFVAESLLLGLAGGLLGLGLALWGRDVLLGLVAGGQSVIVTLDTRIDSLVFAFAFGTALVTGLACGVIPALRGTRVPMSDSLRLQARTVGAHSRRTLVVGRVLVAAQMAFCLLLLVVAGLFVRSFRALASSEIGFDRQQVITARLDVRSLGLSDNERQLLYQRLIDRMQAIPGVVSASLSLNGPLVTSSLISGISVEGHRGQRFSTHQEVVTERYFSTVGLKILRGRGFVPDDRRPGSRSTVINETMARKFFAGQDPIGKRWAYSDDALRSSEAFVIVGVVEDAKYRTLRDDASTMAYQCSGPAHDNVLNDLEIRASVVPGTLVATLRRALTEAEPGLPVYDLAPLDQRVARSLAQDAIVAQLTSVFGFIALLLACLGLYGTILYGVTQRSPELGLRIALGADRRRVLWLVLREALVLVVVGGLVGLPLTYAAGRGLGTLLYVIGPMDPVVYTIGAILLMTVGLLAAFLPALRASRIEPMTALGRG